MHKKILKISFEGFPGQNFILTIISPLKLLQFNFGTDSIKSEIKQSETEGIILSTISSILDNKSDKLILNFE